MQNDVPDAGCVTAQLALYRRALGYRYGALGGIAAVVLAIAALFVFPQPPLTLSLAAIAFVVIAWFSWRAFVKSRAIGAELYERVAVEGNRYCCPCGRPAARYYWLHYFLVVLAPAGLFALAFPLKRCRSCRHPFSAA